jgi:hypothetical protein
VLILRGFKSFVLEVQMIKGLEACFLEVQIMQGLGDFWFGPEEFLRGIACRNWGDPVRCILLQMLPQEYRSVNR